MKDKLAKLVVAIEREIREAKMRQDKKKTDERLKKSEENFRHSLDDSHWAFALSPLMAKHSTPIRRF